MSCPVDPVLCVSEDEEDKETVSKPAVIKKNKDVEKDDYQPRISLPSTRATVSH